jgi:vitamin B12 transporter
MKSTLTFWTLAAACAAASSPAWANDKLEEIIVTSSRVEMPLRKIGTSVSVISGQEIRDQGFNSLFDVLRNQPSISVSNAGGAGKATALRIRGESGYRTLVMLDGIDITDTSGTQASPRLEHILSSGLQRVEILRGPQGLMYGADAGGVINIESRRPESGLAGDISAEGGRYGTRQFAANLGGGNDRLDFNLSAVDYETDGFNSRSTDTEVRDDDGYENTTLHGRLGWNATEELRFTLIARDVSGDNEFDGCFSNTTFAQVDDCSDEFDQSSYRVTADFNSGVFKNNLAYSDTDTDKAFYSEGALSFAAEGGLASWEYLGSWRGSDSLQLVYGVDLTTESIDDGNVDTSRDQDGYYLEYQGELRNRFYTTAGIRYDDNDDFGSHTSYRLSAAYLVDLGSAQLKLRGAYGTGFRAPSLFEISYNNGPFAAPPASTTALKEETSEGYDLGIEYYGSNGLYLEAVYFHQQVDDLIDFDLAFFSGYLQFEGESRSKGVELVAELPVLDSLLLSGNYTYNDAEDPDGARRLRAPRHLANLGISYRMLNNRLALNLFVRASRDAVDGFGVKIDDYEVVNLSASYQIVDSLELYGRIENLLDEDYQEIPTYNTSGAAGYAGVRYSF